MSTETKTESAGAQLSVALWQYILFLRTEEKLTASQIKHLAFWDSELGFADEQGAA